MESRLQKRRIVGTLAALASLGMVLSCGKFFVSAHDLASLSLSPVNPTITLTNSSGQASTQQFTATGTFGDLSTKDISSSVTWSSSSQSTATINSSGLATAVALGSTTITATSGSMKAATTLTVASVAAKSVAIGCGQNSLNCSTSGATLSTGTGVQLIATATLTDNTTKDVTTQATWTSSNNAVATVNNQGFVTAVGIGTANITATFQGATSPAFQITVSF